MKVLGLISSLSDPASRARIIQYTDRFTATGHTLIPRFFTPLKDADPASWAHYLKKITGINEWRSSDFLKMMGRIPLLLEQSGFDIIWQNRLLQSHHFFWETKLRKPVVFDFDDAIWMTEGKKQVSRKIEMSAMIFAGNEYLAEFASSYNKNVVIVPTTIDTEKLFPLNQPPEKFTIGWIGTETNFEYLKTIYQPLKIFLSANKETRLMIVSSHLPDFLKIDNGQMIFKQWEAEKENQYINQFSIGIMPLTDTEWTRGKCSYKMLQYMACGKPVVASPVGVNNKLFREAEIGIPAKTGDEWIRAFTRLKSDSVFFKTCAENGRALVEKDYSIDTYHPLILSYFKRISRQ